MNNTIASIPLCNREISWLFFNERVLQEAEDVSVPIIERIRFLGIFSSNLDEFYRVRVATITRLTHVNAKAKELLGFNPRAVLTEIQRKVIELERRFQRLYDVITLNELAARKIFILKENQLNVMRGNFVREYFQQKVLANLVPIMLSKKNGRFVIPELKDRRIYFFIRMSHKGKQVEHALLEIPTKLLGRFLVLPGERHLKYLILLDDVIRYCLDDLFFIFPHDRIEAYSFQMTRDSEMDLDVRMEEQVIDLISKSLKKRASGKPMRMLYDPEMPSDMLHQLALGLNLPPETFIAGTRYPNFKDFISFPDMGDPSLVYAPQKPLSVYGLRLDKSIFNQIRQKDYLVCLPYHPFDYIIHFLREAAMDTQVVSISITLYRLAENSKVINALINAARNGKKVFCMIELKARFDEEANIHWANVMSQAGVQVSVGQLDYKVHSKICLVARREGRRLAYYANLSTGNYNEHSSRQYSDASLFTTHAGICNDLKKVFRGLVNNKFFYSYKHLLVSPTTYRKEIYKLIDYEIAEAKKGRKASVILKMNSLSDEGLILKLYQASNAGVQIQLIVRGLCCLVPGQKRYSKNIRVVSIIDRYLEHMRVSIFYHGGEERVYLSSADMMTRNLEQRLEVGFPIYDQSVKVMLKTMIELQLKDNVKARIIDAKNSNSYLRHSSVNQVRSQEAIYDFLAGMHQHEG
ncbi:polyphosphate kinase 1 [Olivibacter sitiensis]|uniref:polyphosphate kinase 1 n=1 Tax=Olivibacter sitiensis TaxID=376470 RepID=UPI0003F61AAE|nr:polyphosphate kinase 1 [Olivibacter sitiensis]